MGHSLHDFAFSASTITHMISNKDLQHKQAMGFWREPGSPPSWQPPSRRERAQLYCRARSAPSHRHVPIPPCAGTPAHAVLLPPCAPDHPHFHCTLHHLSVLFINVAPALQALLNVDYVALHWQWLQSQSAKTHIVHFDVHLLEAGCRTHQNVQKWAHLVQHLVQPNVSRRTRYLQEPPPSPSFLFLCVSISGFLPSAVCTTYLQPRVA